MQGASRRKELSTNNCAFMRCGSASLARPRTGFHHSALGGGGVHGHPKTAARGWPRDSCLINLLFQPADVKILEKSVGREKRGTSGVPSPSPGVEAKLLCYFVGIPWKLLHFRQKFELSRELLGKAPGLSWEALSRPNVLKNECLLCVSAGIQ